MKWRDKTNKEVRHLWLPERSRKEREGGKKPVEGKRRKTRGERRRKVMR